MIHVYESRLDLSCFIMFYPFPYTPHIDHSIIPTTSCLPATTEVQVRMANRSRCSRAPNPWHVHGWKMRAPLGIHWALSTALFGPPSSRTMRCSSPWPMNKTRNHISCSVPCEKPLTVTEWNEDIWRLFSGSPWVPEPGCLESWCLQSSVPQWCGNTPSLRPPSAESHRCLDGPDVIRCCSNYQQLAVVP